MTTRAVVTRSAVVEDEKRLRSVLTIFLDVPNYDTHQTEYNAHEIVLALTAQGITHFNRDFLSLSEADIRDLTYIEEGTLTSISLINKRRLTILLAFYHYTCTLAKGQVKLENLPRTEFDKFRTNEYDPNTPIRPWKSVLAKPTDSSGETELSIWKKSVRPNKTEYKEFRDESLWTRAKEQFNTTLESHNLSHLIDPKHVITDANLDQAQRGWLYSAMQTAFKAPMAKTIVTKHLADKDTRLIWKELCEYYDSSMTSVLRAQQVSTYLTSTRLHNLGWRGTQTNFILHYSEQARIYNEISPEEFKDSQLISFLNACLSGTPNLAQVLNLHRTATKAAGVTSTLNFNEYVALLLDQAQVHDAGNTNGTNPRARRSVNTHEFIFEDSDPTDVANYEIYKSEIHDDETPLEYLINRTEQGPRRPRLDHNTWKSLSQEDQVAWDTVSDKGKSSIMSYAAKNPTRFNGTTGILKNADKRTRFSDQINSRQANSHEQINSETAATNIPEATANGSTTLEVSTHQLVPKDKQPNDFDDILTMATTKTTSKSNPDAHLTINQIMSTPSRAAKVHETHYQRTDYNLEAFVHKVKIGDYEYEVESDEGNDFTYEIEEDNATEEPFDYSAYLDKEVEKVDDPQGDTSFLVDPNTADEPFDYTSCLDKDAEPVIDLLDDTSFLKDQYKPSPEIVAFKATIANLETVEDLISFHDDPQADVTTKVLDNRTLTKEDFEDIESEEEEEFDFSKALAETHITDPSSEDDPEKLMGVEESKSEHTTTPPQETKSPVFGMMKAPYDFIQKPSPTLSRIQPNDDGTKFVFTKEDDDLPELEPQTLFTEPLEHDYAQYLVTEDDDRVNIQYNEYIDDPEVTPPCIVEDTNEPKFYKKPSVETNTTNTVDGEWQVAQGKKKKTKKGPTTFCNFLSPKSYAQAAMSSSSSGSSPSSKSSTSPLSKSDTPSTSKKDFQEAGSD